MNKIEYSCGHIFYKEKRSFCANFQGNINCKFFQSYSYMYRAQTLRLINVLHVKNCSTGFKTGQKKASFHVHEDQELKPKWIYSVNRKDWLPTAHQSYVSIILKKNL